MEINPVLLKIRKLLELASEDRNSSKHEAESAMAKVQELMMKYELDMEDVEKHGTAEPESFVTMPSGEPFTRDSVQSTFCIWIVQDFFHVKCFTAHDFVLLSVPGKPGYRKIKHICEGEKWEGRRHVFLGRKTNVQIAQYVYGYLHEEFQRQWKQYHNETGGGNRLDFFRGLYIGLRDKLRSERGMLELQAQREGLVKHDDSAALKEYIEQEFPETGRHSSGPRGWMDRDSVDDGKRAGRKLNIRPAVNESRGTRSLPPTRNR